MRRTLPIWLRRVSRAVQAAACAIGLMIMLTLPAARPHQFIAHFRVSDIGRQAQRHSFVDQSINTACEQIVTCYREAGKIPLRPHDGLRAVSSGDMEIAPPTRPFLRHKLGIPGRPSEDPLI